MKTDRLTLALEHGALQIIVEQDSRHAAPGIEGADVAAQKVLHSRIEEEAQVDVARVRKHHHKGHQRPAGATDLEMAKVSPVDLALFARQRPQPQVRLGCGPWPIQADQMPEVIRAALVSALAHHGMQPAGREVGEFGQGLPDERQIRVDHRGAQLRAMPGLSSLRQHTTHGRVMQVELARDGAAAPLLDVIQAQDPGPSSAVMVTNTLRGQSGGSRDGLRRRTKSIRTNNGSRLQQRQHRDERDVAVAAGPSRRTGCPPATAIEAGGTTSSTSGAGEP